MRISGQRLMSFQAGEMGKKMALFHSDLASDDVVAHCGGITLPDAISGSEIKIYS
ncbi:hypothetical protein ACNKHL_14200 [Shigella flexneri]